MRKILVPIDESEYSKKVVERAGELAKEDGVKLILLHVFNRAKYRMYEAMFEEMKEQAGGEIPYRTLQDFEEDGAILCETLAKDHLNKGLEVKVIGRVGEPAEEILKVAEEEKPDLILIGSRGMSNIEALPLGHTARAVVAHAPCDVYVIKADR
jgi:nucleotide-binding universal stress UspA family protein